MLPILCIPAGRRRYLDILSRYLQRERDTFDYAMLWSNMWEKDEPYYLDELADKYDFYRVMHLRHHDGIAIGHFVRYLDFYQFCDQDRYYVKMDDDIVWMAPGAIAKLVEFKHANPNYLIAIGNIINNTYTNVLYNNIAALGSMTADCGVKASDRLGHYDIRFAARLHSTFLDMLERKEDVESRFDFGAHPVLDYVRAPNHVFTWHYGDIPLEMKEPDERWLTSSYAKTQKRPVCYYGGAMFSHFAYTPQRKHLDTCTNLLERYEALSLEVADVQQDRTDPAPKPVAD